MGDLFFPKNINDLLPKPMDEFRLRKFVQDIYLMMQGTTIVDSNLPISVPNLVLCGLSLAGGTAVTATVSSGVATIHHVAHGYTTGDIIVPAGATSGGAIGNFNTLHVITVVDADNYTFVTTATGVISTPKEYFWFKGTRSLNPTLFSNFVRVSAGVYTWTFANIQADRFIGVSSIQGSDGGNANGIQAIYWTGGAMTTTSGTIAFQESGAPADTTSYLYVALCGVI